MERLRLDRQSTTGSAAALFVAVIAVGTITYALYERGFLPRPTAEQRLRTTREYITRVTGHPFDGASIEREASDGETSAQFQGRLDRDVAATIARDLPIAPTPQPWPGSAFSRGGASGV